MPGVGPGLVAAAQAGTSQSAGYDSNIPSATVIVGPVTIDDTAIATVDPTSLNNSVFDEYIINSRFEHDGHRYMMGITSATPFNGSSVAFVQLASHTLLWIADWTALIKGPLRVPNPALQDPNWIVLDAHVEPAAVVACPDGETPLYRISGTFVYGHKNPDASIMKMVVIPRLPWVTNGIFQTTIQPADQDDTLLLPQQGGGTGGGTSSSSTPIAPGIKSRNQSPGDSPQATGE